MADRFTSRDTAEPFTAPDGSTIRELAHPRSSAAHRQSLAEASLEPGRATVEHYHRQSEELYFFTEGCAEMTLDGAEREVSAGDCVVIAPGIRHSIRNIGEGSLRFLCCCAPPYSDADTVLVGE